MSRLPAARVPHVVRPNERDTSLRLLLTVDTEAFVDEISSTEQRHRLRFGYVRLDRIGPNLHVDKTEYRRFDTPDQFWTFALGVIPRGRKALLIAHNAPYDLTQLHWYHELAARGWTLGKCVLDDPPFIVSFHERKDGKVLRSLDVICTTNYLRQPLGALAASVGRHKLAMPKPGADQEAWDVYCRRDVDVLADWYLLLLWWLADHNCGQLSYTAASQAWHAFRHRWMTEPIYIHADAHVTALERRAYYGGRCEAFHMGAGDGRMWHQLDVNSLYPSVCATSPLPTRLVGRCQVGDAGLLARLLAHYCVIADVTLRSESPAWPYRYKGRLTHPVGEYPTTLTTPELRLALADGAVADVGQVAWYEGAPFLAGYMGDMYALRMQARSDGDRQTEALAKMLLNGLTGKFGQQAWTWDQVGTCDPYQLDQYHVYDAEQQRWRTFRRILGQVHERTERMETTESFPAVSAHITAGGRARLWHLLTVAGRDHTCYCDTDSLIVDDAGLDALRPYIDADRMGSLRIERSSRDVEVWGAKAYRMGTKLRHRGIRHDAVPDVDGGWQQWHWRSLGYRMRHGMPDSIVVQKVRRSMTHEYVKGDVQEDGTVLPLRLPRPGKDRPAG